MPKHRCTMFGKKAVPHKVPVVYEGAVGGRWSVNLRTCRSVRVCPSCAVKVGDRRAQELGAAIGRARATGLAAMPEKRGKNRRCISGAKPAMGPQTVPW